MAGRNISFTEVFNLQKERRRSRVSRVPSVFSSKRWSNVIPSETFFNINKLGDFMTKTIYSLQDGTIKDLKDIKKFVSEIPDMYITDVTNWKDQYDLNIIHYCIIYNRPGLLSFLLHETKLFPVTSEPAICPYAHLAAFLGQIDCLKIIIVMRPADLFKAKLPKHAVKLPNILLMGFKKAEEANPGIARRIQATFNQFSTEETETKSRRNTASAGVDVVDKLENDVGGIEKSMLKSRRKFEGLCSMSNKSITTNNEITESRSTSSSVGMGLRKAKKKPTFHGSKSKKPHTITVHLDVFGDEREGVLKGAGALVNRKLIHVHETRSAVDIVRNRSIIFDHSLEPKRKRSISKSPDRQKRLTSVVKTFSCTSTASSKSSGSLCMRRLASSQVFQPELAPEVEVGIKKVTKIKQFELKIEPKIIERKDSKLWMNKSPLTYAAERGHIDCIRLILSVVVPKATKRESVLEPLTLATKARSPESIIVMMMNQKISLMDYQRAVLVAIRNLFPDCLAVLLKTKDIDRKQILDGTSMLHILYSQSLVEDYRYDMLPEMTQTLIKCKENVNSRTTRRSYPMYTLIKCAFTVELGSKMRYYLECLEILLKANANPHYDEIQAESSMPNTGTINTVCRDAYNSALHCVFQNACKAVRFNGMSYWFKLLLKKIIITIVLHDTTRRRILNDILFDYMESVAELGLDRIIIKFILRYGGNPDFKKNGLYAVNIYFDKMLPYLTRFEVISSYQTYQTDLDRLMLICCSMSRDCFKDAFKIFLEQHFVNTPLQGLPLTKYFCYLARDLLQYPPSLKSIVSQYIWTKLFKNEQTVMKLPVSRDIIMLILP